MKLRTAWLAGKAFFGDHSETILAGVSIAGTVAAVFFALKDGPKCARILDEMSEDEEVTNIEKAGAIGKTMWRTGMALAVSVGATLLNRKLTLGKIAGLTETCLVLRDLNKEREEHTERVVGKEKADEIRQSMAKEQYDKLRDDEIIETGHGNKLFYDEWSRTWFRSDANFLQKKGLEAINLIKNCDDTLMVNEFYISIGLPSVRGQRMMGWHPEHFTCHSDEMFLYFTGGWDDNKGEPYAIMKFLDDPTPIKHPNSTRYS